MASEENKPEVCPKCGSQKIAKIVYGEPDGSPEFLAELRAGKIFLGGCCLVADAPNPLWHCMSCNSDF